jgi:hypothetical protein
MSSSYEKPQLIVSFAIPELGAHVEGFMSCTGNEGHGPNPGAGCGEDHSPK